jgi:hypothetical protein
VPGSPATTQEPTPPAKGQYVVHVIATAHFNLYVNAADGESAAKGALREMEDHPDGKLASIVDLRMRVTACDELTIPEAPKP